MILCLPKALTEAVELLPRQGPVAERPRRLPVHRSIPYTPHTLRKQGLGLLVQVQWWDHVLPKGLATIWTLKISSDSAPPPVRDHSL